MRQPPLRSNPERSGYAGSSDWLSGSVVDGVRKDGVRVTRVGDERRHDHGGGFLRLLVSCFGRETLLLGHLRFFRRLRVSGNGLDRSGLWVQEGLLSGYLRGLLRVLFDL